jgi:beta-galactosidase
VDYRGEFTRDLDMLGYDSYPMFAFSEGGRAAAHAFNLDRTRAWSGNFIVPEHQAGPGGQAEYFHDNPEPGEMRLMTYRSLAHGADGILYFRWRTCRYGAEAYWCGILDHDNAPRRRYEELRQIGGELRTAGPRLLGTSVHMDGAVAFADYDAMEAHDTLPFGLPSLSSHAETVHRWFFENGFAFGCAHPADVLDGLRLYILPHWELVNPDWIPNLLRFVEGGGTLILGARCGTRDLNNHVLAETPPGPLRPLAGAFVQEYSRKNIAGERPWILDWEGQMFPAGDWVEILGTDEGTEVLARWTSRHAAGTAAVTRRRHGGGQVISVGTLLTESFMKTFGNTLAGLAGLSEALPDMPPGIEYIRRKAPGRTVHFLLNGTDAPLSVPAPPGGEVLVGAAPVNGSFSLPAYGVSVWEECR